MQIVIDISEELYKHIKNDNVYYLEDGGVLYDIVKNGTPLPKGHGRLGDLDALRDEVSSWGMNDYEPSDFTDAIDQTDTIIEADKEGGDDQE